MSSLRALLALPIPPDTRSEIPRARAISLSHTHTYIDTHAQRETVSSWSLMQMERMQRFCE